MRDRTVQAESSIRSEQMSPLDEDTGTSLGIADIFRMLARHKWFIVICIVAAAGISLLYIARATPIYEATASIRIDPGRAGSLGLGDLAGGGGQSSEMTSTEIAILKSDAVAIDTLDSLSDQEFRAYTGADKRNLAIPLGATSLTPAQEGLLGGFKGSLNASQFQSTQLVLITIRNPNPKIAAVLVNHVIAAYLRQSFDSRYGSVNQVKTWLSTEMDSLKDRAAQAQRKLADFQEKNDILTTESGGGSAAATPNNTTTDRLLSLNTRLTQAQADRIVKEAQMRAAETGSPAVLAAIYPSANITSLETEQGRLYNEYVQLSTKFDSNYPPLAELKVQMQKVDLQLQQAVSSIKSRLKEEYDSAKAVESLLQQQYDEQTLKAYALNRQQAEYAVLKAEGNSSRELYNTLEYKLQQAGVDAGLNGVNTMLVDSARAPLRPVEPKKTAILSFGLVLGLFAGVGAAFFKEATSDKIQGVDQIQQALGFHLLAMIPHMPPPSSAAKNGSPGAAGRTAYPISYTEPLSRSAEAYRTLRNSILLSSIDSPPKTVLVTSTIAGEGKSNTTANYAVVLAQKGARVLALDADLRRPTLHDRFAMPNDVGLTNVLLGEVEAIPFMNPLPDLPNLFVITAGRRAPLPSEALGSSKFYSLLLQWEKEFDYIVIDSAPLLIVSDSLPMASWVDALILVARYNMTPMGALKRVRDVLRRTNSNVAGVIINDMTGSASEYGGYQYGYGYGDGYYK